MDDIIIYSQTTDEHSLTLRKTFERLKEAQVKLRLSKCRLGLKQIEYLGHIITHNKVMPSKDKVKAVSDFAVPTDKLSVQRFLGLAGFYRRFIECFSVISSPLTRLTKNAVEFQWTEKEDHAFNTLKRLLTTTPILAIYDPKRETQIMTDACQVGIGAILSQKDDNGNLRVVSYYSRRTTPAEQNYSVTELECLAVVESVEHYHIYLHGKAFKLITDHSSLQWLLSLKNPRSRLFRWSMRLSVYSFRIKHRPGNKNTAADALSRSPISLFLKAEDIKHHQSDKPPDIPGICIRNGLHQIKRKGVYRTIVPEDLRSNVLKHYYENHDHPGAQKTIGLITKSGGHELRMISLNT